MYISSSVPCQLARNLLRLLVGMTTIALMLGALGSGSAHATTPPSASFSVEPTFYGRNTGPYTSLSRGYFIYHTSPGAHIHDSMHVTNHGSARGTINLYAVDATTGQQTGTIFFPHTHLQRDVGEWITLSTQHLTLGPGQSQEVPFTLVVPNTVRPGDHGGGVVVEEATKENQTQLPGGITTNIGIQSLITLGVLVILPGNTVESLQATAIRYDQLSIYQRVLITLTNTGTELLHPSGSLQVMDKQGRLLQDITIKMDTFLPKTTIDYPIYMQHTKLALGQSYIAKLSLQYEHSHTLNYSAPFSVPQPGTGGINDFVQRLLATPDNNTHALAPWQYIVGLFTLILVLGIVLAWGMAIRKALVRRRG